LENPAFGVPHAAALSALHRAPAAAVTGKPDLDETSVSGLLNSSPPISARADQAYL
jgi:hypothetical protein